MNGSQRIAAERRRQIEVEGWTPEHDAEHALAEMTLAARAYLHHASLILRGAPGYINGCLPPEWPWGEEWWKDADPIRSLEKAGALIAAEIDRLLAEAGEVVSNSEYSRVSHGHFVVDFSEPATTGAGHHYNRNGSCDVLCSTVERALALVRLEHPECVVHVVRRVGGRSSILVDALQVESSVSA